MRLYYKIMHVMFVSFLLFLNVSYASDPREWSPTRKLPEEKRPKNLLDIPITVPGDVRASQFFSPISCGACHPEIYKMWSGSTHANAWRNPLFQALYNLGKKTAEGASEKRTIESCVRCHIPIGHSRGDALPATDDEKGGVICDF